MAGRSRIERHGSCVNEWRLSILNADGSSFTGLLSTGSAAAMKRLAKSSIDEALAKGWITCPCQPTGNA